MAKGNTVEIGLRSRQIAKSRFNHSLVGCTVTIYEHMNGDISIGYASA